MDGNHIPSENLRKYFLLPSDPNRLGGVIGKRWNSVGKDGGSNHAIEKFFIKYKFTLDLLNRIQLPE